MSGNPPTRTTQGPYFLAYAIPHVVAALLWGFLYLPVAIGRRTGYLESVTDAAAHIAGCTMSNDVSERESQLETSGGQWSKGRFLESFNPLGPALVPADEITTHDLRLRSFVSGDPPGFQHLDFRTFPGSETPDY